MTAWGEAKSFELPKKLDAFLAVLARRYQAARKDGLHEVVVNATIHVDQEWTYDNWDGGQSGHRIRLLLPHELYGRVMDKEAALEKAICEDLSKLAKGIPGEFVAEVAIGLNEEPIPSDWREKSGVLLSPRPSLEKTSDSDESRLWGGGRPRMFLSHRAQEKLIATALKKELEALGAAAFVAHEDIEPTKEWQGEIERALGSMDVLVAILTAGFRSSHWTNQEIGVAIGRGIPVLSLRLGEDPAGFTGRFQAILCDRERIDRAAWSICTHLIRKGGCVRQILSAVVERWEGAENYSNAHKIMAILGELSDLPEELLARLEAAREANSQLRSNFLNREFPQFAARIRANRRSTTA